MVLWKTLKRNLPSFLDRILLMIVGAWLLIQYIDLNSPEIGRLLRHVEHSLTIAFWLSDLTVSYLRPKDEGTLREFAPRWSGIIVILLTGFAAALLLTKSSIEVAGIIILCTLILAAIVWRFATIHAEEIGETKFKTRGDADCANGN